MFSDLFSGSTTGANESKNMTLATRLALEVQQQQLNVGRSSDVGSGGANNRV